MPTIAPSALYGIYKQIKPHLSSMRIGGVVGDANHGSGYHISRSSLRAKGKSGDYSIQAPADKRGGADYASAIDITLNAAEMKAVTIRLKKACEDNDDRIESIREFIGTIDGRNVCGYNRYQTGRRTGWYSSGYSDSSHLWHIHISIFRDYCDDKNKMTGLAEVVAGLKAGTLGWNVGGAVVAPPAVVLPPLVKPPVVVAAPVVKPPVVKPPAVKLPTYYVDPEKVSSQLWALHEKRDNKLVDPRFAITTAKEIKTIDGKKWLVTNAGYRYALDYLTATEPAPAPTEPTPEPEGNTVRIAFWNTRRSSYEGDHGTARDWERRRPLTNDFLTEVGPLDILLTCETTKDQTIDLAKYTGMVGIGNGLGGHPKDVSGDNTAVFVGSKLEKVKVVTVPSAGAHRRYLTAVQVKVKATGETLWVGATHLDRGNSQAAKEVEISSLINGAKARGVDLARFVLGGDINDPAVTAVAGVRRAAKTLGLDDIRDRLADADFRGDGWDTFTGWTATVEKTGRHIDALFAGSMVTVVNGEIVPVRNGASDHHLLVTKVTL